MAIICSSLQTKLGQRIHNSISSFGKRCHQGFCCKTQSSALRTTLNEEILETHVDSCLKLIFFCEGVPGDRFDCKEACAIGSAALVFFRNRASAPRDMSASAASELRDACSEVLLDMF